MHDIITLHSDIAVWIPVYIMLEYPRRWTTSRNVIILFRYLTITEDSFMSCTAASYVLKYITVLALHSQTFNRLVVIMAGGDHTLT